MWKVMAADDEAYMRNALAHMIPWQENGCALAGIYENGRRLIDAMEEGHPSSRIFACRKWTGSRSAGTFTSTAPKRG